MVGTLRPAALEKRFVLVEHKDVEAEAVVLVLASVVISQLEAGVQRDFTSGHEPCRCSVYL